MGKHIWGAVMSLLILIAGLWLMQSPFAFGYQTGGASWADSTKNDFWLGLAIVVVSLIGVVLFAMALVEELRVLGVIRRRPARQPAPPVVPPPYSMPQPTSQTADLERVLLPVATALLADMAERRGMQSQPPHDNQRSTPPATSYPRGEGEGR